MKSKSRLKKILFVPDVHRKYHDDRAWKLVMKVGKVFKPDVIQILGDFIDFYSISTFSKDPNRVNKLDEEIASGNEGLDELDSLGATQKTYIAGNHEFRLERFLKDKAPQLFNFIQIEKLLRLSDRGWQYIPYKQDTKLGKLFSTHDIGVTGRFAAHRSLDTYQHNIVTAHTHRLVYLVEGNASGETHLASSFGWLGDANMIDYEHRAKILKDCALGFGIGYLDTKTDEVFINPISIINYKVVVEGILYEG